MYKFQYVLLFLSQETQIMKILSLDIMVYMLIYLKNPNKLSNNNTVGIYFTPSSKFLLKK